MRLVRPSLVTVAATLLVSTMLMTAPASAGPEVERDGDHFPFSTTTTVPAGGSSTITSPAVGKKVDTLKVTVQPQAGATNAEEDEFAHMVHLLGKLTKGGRLLACIMMYELVVFGDDPYDDDAEISVAGVTLGLAMVGACLQLAGLLAQNRGTPNGEIHPKARAGKSCDQIRPTLPATVEKTDGGYSVTAAGTTKKAKKPPLRVGCRVKGKKVIYKVRAAKKGVPLRRVVGKQLSIGLLSPADAETSVPVKITFATP